MRHRDERSACSAVAAGPFAGSFIELRKECGAAASRRSGPIQAHLARWAEEVQDQGIFECHGGVGHVRR